MKPLSNKLRDNKSVDLAEHRNHIDWWQEPSATPILSKIGYLILVYMIYTYYELDGWYGFTTIDFSDIMTFILVWLFSHLWSRAVYYADRHRMS